MKKQHDNQDILQATVTVTRVFAYKDSGWCSFLAEDGEGNILRMVGTLLTEPKPGQAYEVVAERSETKYGTQYQIERVETALPETAAGIYEYLAAGNIKGIGKVTARKIVDKFGAKALDVIHTEPELLLQINGISEKKLATIIAHSEENRVLEDVYRFTYGAVTRLQAKMLYSTYGKNTIAKLREDPYKTLCQLDGIGFLKADKVAMSCGISEFSPLRMENAVMYVLDEVVTNNGDSYASTERMEQEVVQLLDRLPSFLDGIRGAKAKVLAAADSYAAERSNLVRDLALTHEQTLELDAWDEKRRKCLPAIADAVLALIGRGEAVYDDAKDRIASKKIYDTELWISGAVEGMLRRNNNQFTDQAGAEQFIEDMEKEGNSYNGDQKAAFLRAMTNRLSIVTGGPGCGKTTVIALIAGYWESLGRPVYLMAPTGRAAQRIKESMSEQLPGNNFFISTIHYLLANKAEAETLEEMQDSEPLVVCDETSMVDIYLAKRFLDMTYRFRVVLVGDADQLPPVGAGNFFRDLIASGKVPATWLTKNYRSTGRIIENSKKIRVGQTELATGQDFAVIGLERDQIPERIAREYDRLLKTEGATIRDICVLTLQRKRGAACVNTLNRLIQERQNPPSKDKLEYVMQGYILRQGDRVIHNKNNYGMERIAKDGTRSYGVFNGDLGVIETINPDIMGDGDGTEDTSWILTVRFDDGSAAQYSETDLLQLELAYAMTVHKAQGSEFPYVIGTFAMDQYTMLGRAIAYTSVTRAKNRYCVVCEKKALAMAIRNAGTSKRETFLQEMLESA